MPGVICGMFLPPGEGQSDLIVLLPCFLLLCPAVGTAKQHQPHAGGAQPRDPRALCCCSSLIFSSQPPLSGQRGTLKVKVLPEEHTYSTHSKNEQGPGETTQHLYPKDNLCPPSLFSLEEGTGDFALQGDDSLLDLWH